MAPGLPYTIANQLAHPGRQCIAFVGDGGFAMLMAEFATACRYELPIKVIINNNASLGQIMWEQLVLGYPEFGIRFEQRPDFAPWAEACGGWASGSTRATSSRRPLAEAFAYPGPALVDVTVNPDEPPMPGKVQYEQAKGFVKAFLSGQPRRATIASTLFRDKISELTVVSAGDAGGDRSARSTTPAPSASTACLRNVRHGRFERAMSRPHRRSGRSITGVEIWLEHDRASFANRMMWLPVALTPAMVAAGVAGVFSRRAAKTVLPARLGGRGRQQPAGPVPAPAGDRPAARGLAAGPLQRWRWVRRPSPRCSSAWSAGMGLLAAVLRRED